MRILSTLLFPFSSVRFCGRNASRLQPLAIEADVAALRFKSDDLLGFSGFKLHFHIVGENYVHHSRYIRSHIIGTRSMDYVVRGRYI